MSNESSSSMSRRSIIKMSGMALAAVWSQRELSAGAAQAGKPIFLAPDRTADIAVHSRAENLFWCDVMAEHAAFFSMLMPGAELATEREQAAKFQRSFQAQYDKAKATTLDQASHAAFNRATIELMKPFIEFKQRMHDAQAAGRVRTLVFPLFFDHTAREAQHGASRLEKLAGGDASVNFMEVVDFWTAAMSDHSELIAHYLDPHEQELIGQALDSSAVFKGFHVGNQDRKLPGGEIVLATEELIDFETAVEEGINAGRVQSILHPTLVDHMRRETLKFVDELKRTGTRT